MDPISHVIFGRTLTASVLADPSRRGVAAAALLGALSPDIDIVVAPFGWDRYLVVHEVGTHSLAGAALTGLAAASLVRLTQVLLDRRRPVQRTRPPFMTLAVTAIIAAHSHLLLDVFSGARLALAWPVLPERASIPLVAMADPLLVAIFASAALALGIGRVHVTRISRALVTLVALVFVAKTALLTAALRTAPPPGSGVRRLVQAEWGALWRWVAYEKDGNQLTASLLVPGRHPVVLFSREASADSPRVRTTRTLSVVENFHAVHELDFAEESVLADGTTAVLWSDIRFCGPGRPPQPVTCGLWFGARFEGSRLVRQEVHVGTWIQTRPAPPEP